MNLTKTLAALAVAFLPASVALADAPAAPAAPAPTPIPTLHCTFKSVTACSAGKACAADDKVAGMSLPLKVTVDFENSAVGSVDENGFARVDKFDTVVSSAAQLIIHGVDGAFGWQVTIHDASDAASLLISSADTSIVAFGNCTNK